MEANPRYGSGLFHRVTQVISLRLIRYKVILHGVVGNGPEGRARRQLLFGKVNFIKFVAVQLPPRHVGGSIGINGFFLTMYQALLGSYHLYLDQSF